MRRLVLAALFVPGVIAVWAGLVRSQADPWWHPVNPYGQSEGVSYGYNLPSTPLTDGLLAVQLVDPLTGASDLSPDLNIYNGSVLDWSHFLQERNSLPDNDDGDFIEITPQIPDLNGDDTVRVMHFEPINGTHTGANNFIAVIGIGGMTPSANAGEVALQIGDGYDTDVRIDGDGAINATGEMQMWTNLGLSLTISEDGLFPKTYAHASLPASDDGAIVFCTDCDQGSSPCASTPGAGAFALRENGAWECGAGAGGVTVGTANTIPKWNATPDDLIDTLLVEAGVPAAGAGGAILQQSGTLNIMDGNDTVDMIQLQWIDVDHTGANNFLTGVNVWGIIGDANATSRAFSGGVGWDSILWANTAVLTMGSDLDYITFQDSTLAGSAFAFDLEHDPTANHNWQWISATSDIMTGDNLIERGIWVDIANANHTNVGGLGNTVRGLDVDAITGDAEALEYAYFAGAGWDAAFHSAGVAHASLAAAANGSIVFCTDCDPATTPCTTVGAQSGAFAFRVNGQWDCPW